MSYLGAMAVSAVQVGRSRPAALRRRAHLGERSDAVAERGFHRSCPAAPADGVGQPALQRRPRVPPGERPYAVLTPRREH